MILIYLITAAVLISASSAYFYYIYSPLPNEPVLNGKVIKQTMQAGDLSRNYIAYIPNNLPQNAGLLIVLHGSKMNALKMRRWTGFELDILADKYGFAVVYPEGYKGNWNDCRKDASFPASRNNVKDVAFIEGIAKLFNRQYSTDDKKTYAFGFSNGGHMALRLAMEKPELVAAVCAIAANLPAPETCSCAFPQSTPRIMLVAGTADTVSPFGGGDITLFGKKLGTCVSAMATAEKFAQINGLQAVIKNEAELYDNNEASADIFNWNVSERPFVSLYVVHGGGHVIPQSKFRFPRIMGKTVKTPDAPLEAVKFFRLAFN